MIWSFGHGAPNTIGLPVNKEMNVYVTSCLIITIFLIKASNQGCTEEGIDMTKYIRVANI